jgi:competence protein ComEC
MLVDTGPPGGASDAGRKVIVPFLSRLGVGRIDVLVLTHGHDDHAGGLRSLARTFPVGRILLPAESLVSLLPDRVRERSSIVSAGDSLSIGGAKVYVLAPSRAAAPSEAGNEVSVVLKVVYGRAVILLTGDEDASHELEMASAYGDFLRADLLKVGHHGSLTGTSIEFLEAVRPRYAALSVGRFNRFGHPSADVLSRLEERGILYGRTDDDGALMFEATPDTLYPLVWQ